MTVLSPDRSVGVVVVTFNSSDVIIGCLESLLAQEGAEPRVVLVDNASTDATVAIVREWAARRAEAGTADPLHEVAGRLGDTDPISTHFTLLHSPVNRGFAGGVNLGLAYLAADPGVQHFWVLNPDAYAEPQATQAILAAARQTPGYGLISGRVCYAEPMHTIQSDGGRINWRTGVTSNINMQRNASETPLPEPSQIEFVSGANMVASRRFYETAGPMKEDYFLYYEEVDWALRRGKLPLIVAPGFITHHHAGTSIGSHTPNRIATPFSYWFLYRSRMRFIRRFRPAAFPLALAYATAKAFQLCMRGAFPQATTLLGAVFGLPAPKAVRGRLSAEAAQIAFGKTQR